MKKNLFYLFALICSMSLFTACSDDEGGLPTDQINTTFSSTDAANQLILTYSGEPMLGKTVTFNSTDGKTATIVLKGADLSLSRSTGAPALSNPSVIPGEISTTLNVTLIPTGDVGYTFEGKDEANNRTIAYKGSVEKGKFSLALDVKMTNNLLGTWDLYPYDPYGEVFPIRLTWESTKKLSLDLFGFGQLTEMYPGNMLSFMTAINMIGDKGLSTQGAMAALLKDVTFREDGNIQASYSEASNLNNPTWVKSPLNMAQYYVKDNKFYLLLNIDAILALVVTNKTQTKMDIADILLPQLMELLPMLSTGIPLGYSVDDKGVLGVYIEKDFGMKILNILLPLLQDEEIIASIMESVNSNPEFASYADVTKAILEQISEVAAGTTKMELGLNFNKAK